jgi:hypothetical protein
MGKLQIDLDRLGEWADKNEMKINPAKSKAVCFTRARVTKPLNYSLRGTEIPEASSCKYLGIILRNDLSWADQVNYTVKKAWKALHFTMRILKKGNSNTKSLAYKSLVPPILVYGVACWDPYRKVHINALERVQNTAAKIAQHKNDSTWETLTECRQVARVCALFKAYMGERAWKDIRDRLEKPCYLIRVDHDRKIRSRKQKTDIGKYSFVNRTTQLWNKLPADSLETASRSLNNFKKRVRNVISEVK